MKGLDYSLTVLTTPRTHIYHVSRASPWWGVTLGVLAAIRVPDSLARVSRVIYTQHTCSFLGHRAQNLVT